MPAQRNFNIDKALSRVASGYAVQGFVADKIFPIVYHTQQSGQVFGIDPNGRFRRIEDSSRAPGSPHRAFNFDDPTKTSFFCDPHGLKGVVPIEFSANAEAEAMAALPTVKNLTDKLLLQRELNLVNGLIAGISQTSSPGTKWNNASGKMIADIKAQKETIRLAIGRAPNTLVIPEVVLERASETTEWATRAFQTLTPEMQARAGLSGVLASMLEIPNVLIANSYYNSAAEGQSPTNVNVWGENVLLAYVDKPTSLDVQNVSQALGMHICWRSGASGQGVDGFEVDREWDKDTRADMIYVDTYYAQFLLNAGAGYLFTNTLE